MRLVNTKAHALLDFGLGLILIFSPWFFGFSTHGTAALVAMIVGVFIAALTLITRFEYSIVKIVPLKWHLRIDFAVGLFFACSPWILDFCSEVFKPHLVFGLAQMVIAATTDRVLYQTFKDSVEKNDTPEINKPAEPKNRKNYF